MEKLFTKDSYENLSLDDVQFVKDVIKKQLLRNIAFKYFEKFKKSGEVTTKYQIHLLEVIAEVFREFFS